MDYLEEYRRKAKEIEKDYIKGKIEMYQTLIKESEQGKGKELELDFYFDGRISAFKFTLSQLQTELKGS